MTRTRIRTRPRAFAVATATMLLAALTSLGPAPARAVTPLGFTTTTTIPGSQGGTESSIAIPFEGPFIGRRLVSWQNPGEVNSSNNGTTWNANSITLQPPGGGDVTNAAEAGRAGDPAQTASGRARTAARPGPRRRR